MDAIVINIEQFHSVNALNGREFGDKVLAAIGEGIQGFLADSEGIASRFEADQFDIYCQHRDDYQALLDRLHDGGDQGEEGVEDDERRQGRQVSLVGALDVVPDHVARTEQEMGERPFRVVVQERDAVERPLVEIAGTLPDLLLLRPMPGEIPQLLPDGEGAAARLERMFLFLVHR
jgi:GGDEF domain-containing protein